MLVAAIACLFAAIVSAANKEPPPDIVKRKEARQLSVKSNSVLEFARLAEFTRTLYIVRRLCYIIGLCRILRIRKIVLEIEK